MTHSSSNCIDPIKKNNRGGLVYLVNETKPFSGKFCKTEVSSELNYKDGKKDGVHISYFRSGQKEEEGNYKDGKRVGKHIKWYGHGQKRSEGNYKDDKKDGVFTVWSDDSRVNYITFEGNYKEGKRIDTLYLRTLEYLLALRFKFKPVTFIYLMVLGVVYFFTKSYYLS